VVVIKLLYSIIQVEFLASKGCTNGSVHKKNQQAINKTTLRIARVGGLIIIGGLLLQSNEGKIKGDLTSQ
jgi:hypothetical protein